MSARLSRGVRRTVCGALVVAGLALADTPAMANQGEAPSLRERVRDLAVATLARRCVTPAIDDVVRQAFASSEFRSALGTTFSITQVGARDDRIDLTVAKPGDRPHTVTLTLTRIVGRGPDGRAGDFVFYVEPGADAESSSVLLALAGALAERIPESALAPCHSRADTFGTRTVALASAALTMLIVVAALLFGFRKLGPAVALVLLSLALDPLYGNAPAVAQSIPPGEEPLLATMLGNGAPLPDGCAFADGQVDRDVVRAMYRCTGGEVRLQLSHPSTPGTHAIVTEQFALTVVDGGPHDDLVRAIEKLIRANESQFEWRMLEVGRGGRGATSALGVPLWLSVLALLGLGAVAAISAARAWPARPPLAWGAALEALIVALSVVVWLQIRVEPPAHGDTAVDVALARDCITSHGALCVGHAASAIGLVQGQAFTYALAAWLHLGWSMRVLSFVAACVLGAATGLLHYATARRFGGVAWLVSALCSALAVDMTGYPALWNPSWFVLPLTVAFLATLAVARGGGVWSAFVAGVGFAITTESHILFGTFVAVAAAIALVAAPRPVVAAATMLAGFALTELVISPLSSATNVLVLRHWVAAHLLPVALILALSAAAVPLLARARRALRDDPESSEAAAVLVWLLSGAVVVGMVLPWAVGRPPQIRYYGAAFPAIGYGAAWLLSRVGWLSRSAIARAGAFLIFAAIFAYRSQTADFARPGWFMDDGDEVAASAGLTDAAALDIMLMVRPLPDGALREAAAAFAGTAEAPQFPSRIVRVVRPRPEVALPEGWSRIRFAHHQIFTSGIDAWTHPQEAEVCPDPANGDACVALTRDDFAEIARNAGGLLHRVFGLRMARSATQIGDWTRRGTPALLWKIPLRATGPDATREIVFDDPSSERIVAVDGTGWTARSDHHVAVDRPAAGVAASITVRTSTEGKFEAGVPPMPFELRAAELGILPGSVHARR